MIWAWGGTGTTMSYESLKPKDQNFDRQTFPKSYPDKRTCTIIPKGKYVVTGPGCFRPLQPKDSMIDDGHSMVLSFNGFIIQWFYHFIELCLIL